MQRRAGRLNLPELEAHETVVLDEVIQLGIVQMAQAKARIWSVTAL